MELIFDGATATQEQWDALYSVPSHPKIKASYVPEWHYDYNKCTSCGSSLNLCKHNPHNVYERVKNKPVFVREEVFTNANENVDADNNNHTTAPTYARQEYNTQEQQPKKQGRRPRGSVQYTMTREQFEEAAELWDSGEGAKEVADAYNVNPKVFNDLLTASGRILKRGRGVGEARRKEWLAKKKQADLQDVA